MKKIKTVLYEVTPEEVTKLPEGCQVLRMDVLLNQFSLIVGGKRVTETQLYKFFIFDLPENLIKLAVGAGRVKQ